MILRKSQREAIGRYVDDLTLRLEYTRPLTWFNSLQKPNPHYLFWFCVAYILAYGVLAPSWGMWALLWILSVLAVGAIAPFPRMRRRKHLTRKEKLKTKWAALEALVGDPKRIGLSVVRSSGTDLRRASSMCSDVG